MKPENPEMTIVIVNWNGEKFLPACLESIVANPPKISYEIVVIDNASTDASLDWFDTDNANRLLSGVNFKLIKSPENLGFGKANNVVIQQCQSKYIFLLNPDTIIKSNAIDLMLDALDAGDNIGASAPKLLNEDESLQPSVWYFPPTPVKTIMENFRLYKLMPPKMRAETLFYSHWNHDESRTVPIVWGAAILFKGDILRRLNGFDTDFEMYGEDMDICVRLAKSGFSLQFVPDAEIIHLGGKSAVQLWSDNAIKPRKIVMGMIFEKKHLTPILFYSNIVTRISIASVKLLLYSLSGRDTENLKKSIKIQKDFMFNQQNDIGL